MGKPKNIFRILQLSDVHAGILDFHLGYCLDKRFFGRLNQATMRHRRLALDRLPKFALLQRESEADFTLCTGDLTSLGSSEEFRHCIGLLDEIRQNAGGNFAFVPGNHDAYVAKNSKALEDAFKVLNNQQLELNCLPAALCVGPVEFVLINPARPCAIWLSTGELTGDAWQKLDYILSKPLPPGIKARVVVSHFPVCDHEGRALSWRTKLVGYEKLLEWASRKRFGALLTGHVHKPFVHHIGGSGPLAVGAGSITICRSCAQIDVNTATGEISAQTITL